MKNISLSNRQIKEADRVGGIELMILWPDDLPAPDLDDGEYDDASPTEHAAAERLVKEACQAADLVPVRSYAECRRRPNTVKTAPSEIRHHLVVIIIGRRWVHASTRRKPKRMWYDP